MEIREVTGPIEGRIITPYYSERQRKTKDLLDLEQKVKQNGDNILETPSRIIFPKLIKENRKDTIIDVINSILETGQKIQKLLDHQHKLIYEEESPIHTKRQYNHDLRTIMNILQIVEFVVMDYNGTEKAKKDIIDAGHYYSMAKSLLTAGIYLGTGDSKFNNLCSTDFKLAYQFQNQFGNADELAEIKTSLNNIVDAETVCSIFQCRNNAEKEYKILNNNSTKGLKINLHTTQSSMRVTNNGTYIPKGIAPKIFEPEFSTNGSTGYGMALLLRGAELKGQEVWLTAPDPSTNEMYSFNATTGEFSEPRYSEGTTFEKISK